MLLLNEKLEDGNKMDALLEITEWSSPLIPNHTYLLDTFILIAYIPQGEVVPRFLRSPAAFNRKDRKFVKADISLFQVGPQKSRHGS